MGPHQPSQAHSAVHLDTLGPFSLTRAGGGVIRLPKKTQGLLTYLAMQTGRPVLREQISTLLWGNSASEQARQSLRQCLAALHNSLGSELWDAIRVDARQLSMITPNNWAIDVSVFEASRGSSDPAKLDYACNLYRGELLAGLHIPVEPFNDWLTVERQRLHALHLELQHKLAVILLERSENTLALTAARKIVLFDPLGEEGHRLLMRLLALSGDRSAALKQYDACVHTLREELGLVPDRETTELAENIRTGGEVGVPELARVALATSTPTQSPVVVSPVRPSIGVLPFANLTGDAKQDAFVDGLVDDITVALGRERGCFVVASASALTLRDRRMDFREAALALGVRYIVRGSVRRDESQVRMVVQLLDATSGNQTWSETFEDQLDNVFAINDRLTSKLAAMLAPAVRHAEIERSRRNPVGSLSAYDLYLRALSKYRASRMDNLEALSYLRRAIEIDPSFACAFGLAARCFHILRTSGWIGVDDPALAEGVALARRAAEVGPQDSEALWMSALALLQIGGDINTSLGMVERSLMLNPNSSDAWTASCLVRNYLGDYGRAFDDFDRSQRLNPLNVSHHLHWNIRAMTHLLTGNYAEAETAADKALTVGPDYCPALRIKVIACGYLGRREEAANHRDRTLAVHPDFSIDWIERYWRGHTKHVLRTLVEGARLAGVRAL